MLCVTVVSHSLRRRVLCLPVLVFSQVPLWGGNLFQVDERFSDPTWRRKGRETHASRNLLLLQQRCWETSVILWRTNVDPLALPSTDPLQSRKVHIWI